RPAGVEDQPGRRVAAGVHGVIDGAVLLLRRRHLLNHDHGHEPLRSEWVWRDPSAPTRTMWDAPVSQYKVDRLSSSQARATAQRAHRFCSRVTPSARPCCRTAEMDDRTSPSTATRTAEMSPTRSLAPGRPAE